MKETLNKKVHIHWVYSYVYIKVDYSKIKLNSCITQKKEGLINDNSKISLFLDIHLLERPMSINMIKQEISY